MDPVQHLAAGLRRLETALRQNSRRVARISTRFNRLALYTWDLLIWSRVEAARAGLIALELPATVLAKKGLCHPPPTLRVRSPNGEFDHLNDGFAAVYVILFGNLQGPDVLSDFRYGLPGPAFRGIYLWDSSFIAQVWRLWDTQVAEEVLRTVVTLRSGDRLQHFVDDFLQSEFTQPPLLAWSLIEVIRTAPVACWPKEKVQVFYEPLCGYHRWLRRERQTCNGLYAWRHPYESGIDNSPRFSTRDENKFERTTGVAAPDFSSYMVLQAEALAQLARILDREADAREFDLEAGRIREAMNSYLWSDEDGYYFDRDTETGRYRRCRTIASLLPLWAGVPDPVKAARMREFVLDSRAFGSLVPFPSVARAEACFEKDMWRGPVWINTAYAVIRGLLRYGYDDEAAELAWRLCDAVYQIFRAERQIYEFYDPDSLHTRDLHRKRGNLWKRITLGAGPQREFVGWSGLVNTLFVEVVFGLRREGGRHRLVPRLPRAAVGSIFRVNLPESRLTVELAMQDRSTLHGFAQTQEGLRSFVCSPGETVDIEELFAREPGLIS